MAQAKSYDEWGNEIPDPRDANPADINPTPDFPTAAPTTSAPAGTFDRQRFRDASMGRPSSQSPADFIAANPSFSTGVTSYQGSKDKYVLPTGEVIDLSINADANGAGTPGWTGTGYNAQGVPDQPASFTASPASTAAASSTAPAANSFQDQIRQMLLQRLKDLGQPPTASDPIIAGQTEAYRNEQMRSADQQRAAAAERAAANGLLNGGQSSGSFDTVVQGINEDAGQKTSAYQAGLLGNELQSRRATMQQLLQMALQTGDSESARSLEMAIAQMDNQLRQQQLSQQGNQFNASLNQNQSQFNDTFGANQAQQYEDNLYRSAILASLGG